MRDLPGNPLRPRPVRPDGSGLASRRELLLVPAGDPEPHLLHGLSRDLGHRLRLDVRVGDPQSLDPGWFDSGRRQYDADLILDHLVRARASPPRWTLAVVDADLFAAGLRFVFGQAALAGCCALVGLARLRNEFYGQPPDTRILRRRLLTEAVHEIGHLHGRRHCPHPQCVMHYSRTIEDSDRKGSRFCARCAV